MGDRKKILVIEDDPDVAMVIGIVARTGGYEVVTAEDAACALEAVREHRPDLITLDLGVPGGGGTSVLGDIRSDETLAEIPVIIVSGSGAVEPAEVDAMGAQAYLQKPFEPSELLGVVRELI